MCIIYYSSRNNTEAWTGAGFSFECAIRQITFCRVPSFDASFRTARGRVGFLFFEAGVIVPNFDLACVGTSPKIESCSALHPISAPHSLKRARKGSCVDRQSIASKRAKRVVQRRDAGQDCQDWLDDDYDDDDGDDDERMG